MASTTFSGPVVSLNGFVGTLTGAAGAAATATTTTAGIVRQGVAVPNAVAAPTKAEFDALLVSLRNAGVLVP